MTDEEYDDRNPPPVLCRTFDDGIYEKMLDDDAWLRTGYIPTPTSPVGWFTYHMIHGMLMRYPFLKVLYFSLRESFFKKEEKECQGE